MLESAGRRTEVDTGRYTFPVGGDSLHGQDGMDDGGQQAKIPNSDDGVGANRVAVDEL